MSICGTPGYIAPETLRHQPIWTPVDLWACGVLLYILLAGYPPFWARQRDDLFEKIKAAEYNFASSDWDNVSASAKSLVRSTLAICPVARITAAEALSHPWICMRRNIAKSLHRQSTLTKLRNFNAWRKLRGAVRSAIALGAFTDMTKDKQKTPLVEGMKVPDPKPKYQDTEEFTSSSVTNLEGIECRRQDSNCSAGSAEEGIVAFYQPFSFPQLPDAFPDVQPGHVAHSQTDYDNEDYLDEGSPQKRQKTSDSLDASSSQD